MKKRVLKTITVGVLCFSLLSNHFVAFAEEPTAIETEVEETEESDNAGTEVSDVEESAEEASTAESKEDASTEEESSEAVEESSEDASTESSSEETENAAIEASSEEEIEEIISMPPFSFNDSIDGMNISISADEGIFPENTSVNISVLDDNSATTIAEQTLGSENVKQAKAVDITFYNSDGIEIQPNGNVNINISYSTIEGDNFTVLHEHDGTVEEINASADSDSASFTSSEFSVFIIVGTGEDNEDDKREVATYKFFIYDSESSSWVPFAGHEEQYIKSGDTLYNPGVPSIDPDKNEEFLGWELEDKTPAPFGIIESVTANEVISVYANITTTYYVTFVGIDNDIVQVKKIPGTQGESAYTTVNDIPYTPKKSTQAFKGWATAPNDESTLIADNNIDASKTTHVYACVIDAFWIHFDENDDTYDDAGNKISSGGASYVGPVAIPQTKTPAEAVPAIPQSSRHGYDFLGWYNGTKNPNNSVTLGDPFNWDSLMTEDVTVYAKWQAHADTELTINIWKQNLDATGYDYVADASKVYEGVTGATITCYENYFHLSDPEGNYPYYSSSDVNLTGFKYDHAEVVDGTGTTVSTLSAKGDTVINVFYNRQSYSLTFQARFGNRWNTVYTITALYEQNISSHFPIKVGNTTYNNFWEVQGNPTTYKTGLLVGKIDKMPAENINFHRYALDGRTFAATWNYYVEALEGTSNTTSYDNIDFILRNAITLDVTEDMQSTEKEEFMDIRGFTKYKADPAFVDGVQQIVRNKPINLYYLRNRYTLTFMNGDTSLKTIGQIPYEQSLSSYESQAPALSDVDGTRFIGWYLDKSGTIPFNWNSTMPIDGQIVYAKFAPIRFRVTLDPAGGTIDTSKQAVSFMEDYNGKLDVNSLNKNISKENWELVGWFYKDGPKAGQAYDFDKITESTTEYTYNEAKGYYEGTVNIIAGWRFPGLVHVVYDAGENGTDAPTADKYGYAYDSTVVVDRPSKPNKGYSFVGWTIKNDTQPNRILYPNSNFAIEMDFVENETITLVAKYEKTGSSGTSTEETTITYHSNDENNKTYVIDKLRVNKGTKAATLEEAFGKGYTRSGYKFLGWSKTSDNQTVWLKAGTEYTIGADNEGVNDLYAVWEPALHITYTDGVEDETIFIDEVYEAFKGDGTPKFSKDTTTLERKGYIFDKWTPAISETVTKDQTYTATWKEDYSVTKTLTYTVEHVVEGEVKDSAEFTEEVWVNDTENLITIQKDSITPKEYKGYKFDSITPSIVVGDKVENNATITLTYIKNEKDTQEVKYIVSHIFNDEVQDTKTVIQNRWVNDPAEAIIEEGDLTPNQYKGYKFDHQDPATAKEKEAIASGTEIKLYYVKNEEDTQDVTYTVNHIVEKEIKDTKTVTKSIWVLDAPKIEIAEGDLATNDYTGYTFDYQDPSVSEGDFVDTDTVINIYYKKDESQTKPVNYTVKHIVDGQEKYSQNYTSEVWINDEAVIEVKKDSLKHTEYTGYKFDNQTPADITEGSLIPTDTTIVLTYVKDDSQTKKLKYTVNHILDNQIKVSADFIEEVWINEENELITVTELSIKPKDFEGYEYEKTINNSTNEVIKANDKVENNTVINVIYKAKEQPPKPEPKKFNVRYEYRFANEKDRPKTLPALPNPYTIIEGEEIHLIPVPTIKGYTLTEWKIEEDNVLLANNKYTPTSDIVIYTIVTKNKPKPTPPGPKPDEPTPEEPDEPIVIDDPTPTVPTIIIPKPTQVLSAMPVYYNTRPRMAATGDDTYPAKRYALISISVLLIFVLLLMMIAETNHNNKKNKK